MRLPGYTDALISSICQDPSCGKNEWNVYTAATKHICFDKSKFSKIDDVYCKGNVKLSVFNEIIPCEGVGTVKFETHAMGRNHLVELNHVLYVPQLKFNILSVICLTEDGYKVEISKESKISKNGETVMVGKCGKSLFVVGEAEPTI